MKKTKKIVNSVEEESSSWSQQVTKYSHVLDLEEGVFTRSPKQIALS